MSLLTDIAIDTGLSVHDVRRIILTAPARYKTFQINKRNNEKRTIAQPSRELKVIQHSIMRLVLNKLRVHDSAMAYVRNKSIADNAKIHRNGKIILKIDFKNFFYSIKPADFTKELRNREEIKFDRTDTLYLVLALFFGVGSKIPQSLSIGAPSSPMVSNIVMYSLDQAFLSQAKSLDLTYTRYADDITVSGNSREKVLEFEARLRGLIKRARYPSLEINEDKRGIYSIAQRQMVTGLIITPDRRVSLGRERKRIISSLVHRYTLGQLDQKTLGYLKGLLGFANACEPEFLSRLRRKYGDEVVANIMQSFTPIRSEM